MIACNLLSATTECTNCSRRYRKCTERDARCFSSGKCRHNSIENDYCGGKPGLSPPSLILTLTLTLKALLNLTVTLLTLLTLIDAQQTLVYRRNSHFQWYCGGIYRRKRFTTTFSRYRMSAEIAHLSKFGAETETETEAEIRSTSNVYI